MNQNNWVSLCLKFWNHIIFFKVKPNQSQFRHQNFHINSKSGLTRHLDGLIKPSSTEHWKHLNNQPKRSQPATRMKEGETRAPLFTLYTWRRGRPAALAVVVVPQSTSRGTRGVTAITSWLCIIKSEAKVRSAGGVWNCLVFVGEKRKFRTNGSLLVAEQRVDVPQGNAMGWIMFFRSNFRKMWSVPTEIYCDFGWEMEGRLLSKSFKWIDKK